MREIRTPVKKLLQACLIAIALCCGSAFGQRAAERAAQLRVQLSDIQTQEADLQTRLAQINEDIKPENIERSLAGVGSTRPEELREARRRQLEIQRQGVQTQLNVLAASRQRLESAIASADAEAYRQVVGPNETSAVSASPGVTGSHRKKAHRPAKRRVVKK